MFLLVSITSNAYSQPYDSDITTSQQNKLNSFISRNITIGNKIYMDQSGSNPVVSIEQIGTQNLITGVAQQDAKIYGDNNSIIINQGSITSVKNEIDLNISGNNNILTINQGYLTVGQIGNNYMLVDIIGYSNTVTAQQTNGYSYMGNYAETTILGNNNLVTHFQSNGNKILFSLINGSWNILETDQRGLGQHYLDITLIGNGNSTYILQDGVTQNKATINLQNVGGPSSLTLNQYGGQTYSITQQCAALSGCSVTVNQGP